MTQHQMVREFVSSALIGLMLLIGAAQSVQACTGITLTAADGTVVHARTMEFAIDLHSDVIVVPRGYARVGPRPTASQGSSGSPNTPASGPMGWDCRSYLTG